jgi:hypothetical protein
MSALFSKPKRAAALPPPKAQVQPRDPVRQQHTDGTSEDDKRRAASGGQEQRLGDYTGSALLTG